MRRQIRARNPWAFVKLAKIPRLGTDTESDYATSSAASRHAAKASARNWRWVGRLHAVGLSAAYGSGKLVLTRPPSPVVCIEKPALGMQHAPDFEQERGVTAVGM